MVRRGKCSPVTGLMAQSSSWIPSMEVHSFGLTRLRPGYYCLIETCPSYGAVGTAVRDSRPSVHLELDLALLQVPA